MANVYRVGQELLGEGSLDCDNPGASAIMAIGLKDNTYAFDETDADLTAVLANGGSALTKSGEGEVDVDDTAAMVVSQVSGGADYLATKTTFPTVAAEAAWTCVIIYVFGASDAARFPIAGFAVNITPNGSDIEIRWNSVDGVGAWMTSRNV